MECTCDRRDEPEPVTCRDVDPDAAIDPLDRDTHVVAAGRRFAQASVAQHVGRGLAEHVFARRVQDAFAHLRIVGARLRLGPPPLDLVGRGPAGELRVRERALDQVVQRVDPLPLPLLAVERRDRQEVERTRVRGRAEVHRQREDGFLGQRIEPASRGREEAGVGDEPRDLLFHGRAEVDALHGAAGDHHRLHRYVLAGIEHQCRQHEPVGRGRSAGVGECVAEGQRPVEPQAGEGVDLVAGTDAQRQRVVELG